MLLQMLLSVKLTRIFDLLPVLTSKVAADLQGGPGEGGGDDVRAGGEDPPVVVQVHARTGDRPRRRVQYLAE